jgi:hypothetical protein
MPEEILAAADFAGSTAAMTDYVMSKKETGGADHRMLDGVQHPAGEMCGSTSLGPVTCAPPYGGFP